MSAAERNSAWAQWLLKLHHKPQLCIHYLGRFPMDPLLHVQEWIARALSRPHQLVHPVSWWILKAVHMNIQCHQMVNSFPLIRQSATSVQCQTRLRRLLLARWITALILQHKHMIPRVQSIQMLHQQVNTSNNNIVFINLGVLCNLHHHTRVSQPIFLHP